MTWEGDAAGRGSGFAGWAGWEAWVECLLVRGRREGGKEGAREGEGIGGWSIRTLHIFLDDSRID